MERERGGGTCVLNGERERGGTCVLNGERERGGGTCVPNGERERRYDVKENRVTCRVSPCERQLPPCLALVRWLAVGWITERCCAVSRILA